MAYKNKSGQIISRKDCERISNKDLKKDFSPCGDIPNSYFDGDEVTSMEQALGPIIGTAATADAAKGDTGEGDE
jgi:hypothetical protein